MDNIASNLQHYIMSILQKRLVNELHFKIVKWQNHYWANTKMLKLPAGSFLLFEQHGVGPAETSLTLMSNLKPTVYYCIGHLPRTQVPANQNIDNLPYWHLPPHTVHDIPNADGVSPKIIIGAPHSYTGERASKYIGFDITNLYIPNKHDHAALCLADALHAITNGDVLQNPRVHLADYVHFLKGHYKQIAALNIYGDERRTQERSRDDRISWNELRTLFGRVFDNNDGADINRGYGWFHLEGGDFFNPVEELSDSYEGKVDKFLLKP